MILMEYVTDEVKGCLYAKRVRALCVDLPPSTRLHCRVGVGLRFSSIQIRSGVERLSEIGGRQDMRCIKPD